MAAAGYTARHERCATAGCPDRHPFRPRPAALGSTGMCNWACPSRTDNQATPCRTRAGSPQVTPRRQNSAGRPTGGSGTARCRPSAPASLGPAWTPPPPSTAATSSASGRASWATAARCCSARSRRPAGPRELQLKGSGMTPYSAPGRWARGAALVDPRIPVLGGDARAGHSDDAGAGAGGVGPARAARTGRDDGGGHAGRAELPALRAFRAFLSPRPQRRLHRAASAGRFRDRPPLPGVPRRHATGGRDAGRGRAPHCGDDGGLAGGRLLPRRDEHRQPVDPRTDDRLRAVRLPRRVRPDAHLQPLGRTGPLRPTPASRRWPTGTCTRWRRPWCR